MDGGGCLSARDARGEAEGFGVWGEVGFQPCGDVIIEMLSRITNNQ